MSSISFVSPSSNSSLSSSSSSSSSNSSLLVARVDLSVVWLLLAGFVLACLLLSAVGGVKWRRHKQRDELTYSHHAAESGAAGGEAGPDAADAGQQQAPQSTASEQLSAFSRQLHSQHASTVSLLAEQQSSVRSQLDRLCAEAEQLKALLAARLSGDRGFVDAAIALLLSDITAAESYRRRQAKREDDVLRVKQDCITQLDDAMHALQAGHTSGGSSGTSVSQSSLSRVKEYCESLIRCVSSAQRECEKERARVRHSSASTSSILGGEAVALLTRHAEDEEEAERLVGRLLHNVHGAADNFLFACLEHDMDATATTSSASKGRGATGSGSSSSASLNRLHLTCRRFHGELARCVGAWPAATASLADSRTARGSDETEALQCLERQKAQVDGEASRGLFAGLDQQLVDSITAIIRQTAAARQQRSEQQAQQHSGVGHHTAAGLSQSTPAASSSLIAALFQSASEALSAFDSAATATPFHSDGLSSSASSPSSLSSASLGASFSVWRENDALLSGLLSAEAARQVVVCGELDRAAVHSGLSAADEGRLRDAAAAVSSLHSTHSAAAVRLGERGRAEEQRAVEQRLAALRDSERDVERQREALQSDFDARMASRATAEADPESNTASARQLQADFQLSMESLHARQQQDALTARTELHAIHAQHRSRVAGQQSDMRRQQQQQMADAMRQYEQIHAALAESAAERCQSDLQLEGVDVPNLRVSTLAALSTQSARETALLTFHQANVDEMNRRQQTERRVMEEDAEQRQRDELRSLRAEWDEDRERQRALDEDEFEQRLRGATDSTAAALIRGQHADEVKKRERRWQDEWSAQEASRAQQHRAAADVRGQQLAAEQSAERAAELSDQRDELFQVRLSACKQQEVALLDAALHSGTRGDGRRLIESTLASRHAAERARLIAQQEADNQQHIARLLDADRTSRSERRLAVQRGIEEGRLSESEAAVALAAVDEDSTSAATSQRIFAAVAESAAASLYSLQSRQWEEVKAAMSRAFPDETFSGSGWQQQQQHGSLSPDVASLAQHAAQVMQSAVDASRDHVAALELEEQAAVQRCRDEQRQAMEQLEAKLAKEEAAIRAQFEQQLQEAQSEHEAKLDQLQSDLQLVRQQQPVDERAVLEYEAAVEDEQQSHASMMQQAAAQFEAEVVLRSEAQRVHLRASQQHSMNDAIRQARSDRQQQEKEAMAQQSRLQSEVKEDAKRAMQLLQRHGRRHRARTLIGVKQAMRALVARYTDTSRQTAQTEQQRAQTQPDDTATQRRQLVASEPTTAVNTPATPQLLRPAAAQLDRVESLIRQLAHREAGSAARPQYEQPSSASLSPESPSLFTSALAASSLTARQRSLLDSVQRVQAAICTSLSLRCLDLHIRLDESQLSGEPASTPLTTPLSHLYTLLSSRHVLLLHDQPHTPVSHHCLAIAFLSAGRHSHFTAATHSASYQTALVAALTAALNAVNGQQRHTWQQQQRQQESEVVEAAAASFMSEHGEDAEYEAVDALNEQLCALLTDSPVGHGHQSVHSSQVQLLLAAMEQTRKESRSVRT